MGIDAARERQLDAMIGVVLRFGVLLAGAMVAVGFVLMLAEHRAGMAHIGAHAPVMVPMPPVRRLLAMALALRPSAWIDLGILTLILTPVVRVAASAAVFLYERDHVYVYFTLIVFGVLIYSLNGH